MRRLFPLSALALLPLLLLALSALPRASAVRHSDFKTCADSSFCRRLRRLSSLPLPRHSPYSLGDIQFAANRAELRAPVLSALHPNVSFELVVRFHRDGTARVQMDQTGERHAGHRRYDEAERWAIDQQPVPAAEGTVLLDEEDNETRVTFGPMGRLTLILTHAPLRAVFLRDGEEQVVLNDQSLLHMEHFRPRPAVFPTPKAEPAADGEEAAVPQLVLQKKRALLEAGHTETHAEFWASFEQEDAGEWQETWSGKPDSKPRGPEALSLDISFPNKAFAFGLPEHASPLNLRDTHGRKEGDFSDPYRLMNTDVFEYEHDSPMSLYGSVPVLHAQGANGAASVFWLNAAETWIDIERVEGSTQTHFFSESGILDLVVFLAPTPAQNMAHFTRLVGRTVLPQYFAMGYHQSRWNYLTTQDVLDVSHAFSEQDIPMDVMWLDIEYSKQHMYMIWDEVTFPDPERMIQGLDDEGRKLVIIVDPHFKRTDDYFVYKEAKELGVLVKTPDGKGEFEGWCWSGSASWIDAFDPKSWEWWASQFRLASKKLRANARNVHIWNDMQEPSIFNGPEVTSPKDVMHYGPWEHRHLHNINGMVFQNLTARGLRERESPARRPFTLARSWWVGTQKYGATWTGDNLGTWEHLAVSVPMMLANNVGGMSFCGADIGGFFGNPEPDMLVRWYQAGIFEPFFRAHAHIDTKRREPFLLDEPERSAVRELIKLRYKMLPVWYAAFKENAASGLPILRPQYMMFPTDVGGFAVDDQYYLADSGLLVKPAVQKDVTSVDVYLGEEQVYYNYFTHEAYHGASGGKRVSVPAPLTGEMPLLQRGGSILPIRERVRRAAELGWRDPLTLIVALNNELRRPVRAEGLLYLDDGQTYEYEQGAFIWRKFLFASMHDGTHLLSSADEARRRELTTSEVDEYATSLPSSYNATDNAFARSIADVRIERVVVLGLEKKPKRVRILATGEELSFKWTPGAAATSKPMIGKPGKASELIIKDPAVSVIRDWAIEIEE